MAEMRPVATANHSPTQCALCLTHEGPFIDTNADFLGYGRVYICMTNEKRSGCVRQMARLDGMVDGEIVNEAMARLDEWGQKIVELERELEESKVVPFLEVLEHLQTIEKAAPAPAGKEG